MADQVAELEDILRGHFLHPHHPLTRAHKDAGFLCDGCRISGKGTRYRSDPCDFNLHIFCAYCPQTLLSPLHPKHRLTLVRKLCGVCSKFIPEYKFYRCRDCQMDFHLDCICSSLQEYPRIVSSSLHPGHNLYRAAHGCDDCSENLTGMFYRCVTCNFDLDPLCHQRTMLTTSTVDSQCSDSARMLSFFMHPEHDLSFVERIQISSPDCAQELRSRWCAVCSDVVEGKCYMCSPCGFRVHKHCASLRPTVRDEAHPLHALHYLRSKPSPCNICKESCSMWRYHCSACNVHIHKHCLKGPAAIALEEAVSAQLRLS